LVGPQRRINDGDQGKNNLLRVRLSKGNEHGLEVRVIWNRLRYYSGTTLSLAKKKKKKKKKKRGKKHSELSG
jgi:hypothetical protein